MTFFKVKRTCSVNQCAGLHKAKNFCDRHYRAFLKYGDPLKRKGSTTDEQLYFLRQLAMNPPDDQCVLWPFLSMSSYDSKPSYGKVTFDGRLQKAHRVALIMYTGYDQPPSVFACHGPCNNPLCVNPHKSHGMYWGDAKSNSNDRFRYGLAKRAKPYQPKPRKKSIKDFPERILSIYKDKRKFHLVAADHNVAISTVWNIRNGKLRPDITNMLNGENKKGD